MSIGQATVATSTPPQRTGGIALWIALVVFLIGVGSLVYALGNERVELDLPLLTASFLYLTGVTQIGVVFAAIMRVVGAHWSKPYYRLAELSTLAFAPLAILGFLFVYFYGRDELFYWLSHEPGSEEHLSPWLDSNWLLTRNLLALLLFYALSTVYALKALQPDLSSEGVDEDKIERQLYLLSPAVILSAALCSTLFAWDFGMMLVEHWHSTVFPILFSFGNLFAGTAALVFFAAILGPGRSAGSPFGPTQLRSLGMLVTGFTLLWLYFFWAQFFVIWFGNLPRETEVLWRQMYGHYAPYYWTMLAGCFFIPFVALLFAVVKRSVLALSVIAVGINVGIWLYKYLTVVPVFSAEDTPFDSWLDVSLALGLLAGFLAALLWLTQRLPIYSSWEIRRTPQPKH